MDPERARRGIGAVRQLRSAARLRAGHRMPPEEPCGSAPRRPGRGRRSGVAARSRGRHEDTLAARGPGRARPRRRSRRGPRASRVIAHAPATSTGPNTALGSIRPVSALMARSWKVQARARPRRLEARPIRPRRRGRSDAPAASRSQPRPASAASAARGEHHELDRKPKQGEPRQKRREHRVDTAGPIEEMIVGPHAGEVRVVRAKSRNPGPPSGPPQRARELAEARQEADDRDRRQPGAPGGAAAQAGGTQRQDQGESSHVQGDYPGFAVPRRLDDLEPRAILGALSPNAFGQSSSTNRKGNTLKR